MNRGAYYNEFDPYAAEWLRNLIAAGLIAPGIVDERSILEVQPEDLNGLTQIHLFAGVGGWPLALRLAGWPDDRPIWTGSCPCQSFSCAGKGEGKKDKRHLWPEMYRLARFHRPPKILGEQVEDAIGHEWLDGVFIDLEREDYACGAVILPAACRNAPHRRHRIYWMADASITECGRGNQSGREYGRTLHASDGSGNDDVADAASLPRAQHVNDARERAGGGTDNTPDGGGDFGGLAVSECPEWRTSGVTGFDDRNRDEAGRSQGSGGLELHCASVALGDGIGTRLERHGGNGDDGNEPGRIDALATGPTAEASHAPPVAHGDGERLSGRTESDGIKEQPGIHASSGTDIGGRGFWSDFILLPCSDGKYRRASTEFGVFPLAHGIPSKRKDARLGYLLARLGELGFDPKAARRIIAEAKSNRVGRLKGFGNAIVSQVAATFIQTVMEISHAQP